MLTDAPHNSCFLKDVPASSAVDTIRKGMRLLSPRVGIIKDIGSGIYYPGDPLFRVFGNKTAETSHFPNCARLENDRSGGAGLSLEAGIAAAIGEAVERYCMRFYDPDDLILGSYSELADRYTLIHPDLARLHSREQIEAKGGTQSIGGYGRTQFFDESTRIRWTRGFSLTKSQSVYVPAHMIYLPYQTIPGEARTGWNSSTGLAAGNTLEEAILSGIYEWVERDAFVICWLNRVIPRRISVDDPALMQIMEDRFYSNHPGVQIDAFDTTLDIQIPSAFVWMRRPTEFGFVSFVGAAARLDTIAAVQKALTEVAQCVPYCRFNLRQRADWEPLEDFSNVRSFEEHAILYLKRRDLLPKAFAFCDEVRETVPLSDMQTSKDMSVLDQINACIRELDRCGYEVIVADLTTSDVREVGLHVVRVFIPGLANLHGNHNWPCFGVRRLYEVPRQLNWESRGWNAAEGFNPSPHPFP